MARNDVLRRYLDAALEFGGLTQARAEELVKELVNAGEVQADQARDAVTDLLDRSRRTSQRLLDTIRAEVREQVESLGLASQADIDRLEERIAGFVRSASDTLQSVADRGAAATGATRKATAKRSPAKKATAKKASAAKSTAKKATAKRATAAKSTAKKATAKATAKKAPAKKATAKKSTRS